jgi:L,D-transpeptidase ErfK/SrfK
MLFVRHAPFLALIPLLLLGACATPSPPPPAAPPPPPVVSNTFPLAPDQPAIGEVRHFAVRPEDTLLDIARDADLGYTQLVTANRGVDAWKPGVGRDIVLPELYLLPSGPRQGIVINLVQQRLFYFPAAGGTVETFPIGVGVQGKATPNGTTRVLEKLTDPVWVVPPSIRAEDKDLPATVPPGPDNPLGDRAFRLGWPGYLIHGTNKPYGIGRNVSHGCIHLYPEDMTRFFDEVAVGTPVRVIDEAVLAGWIGGTLYIAVFPDKDQAEALDTNQPVPPDVPRDLHAIVRKTAGKEAARVDWTAVDAAGRDRSGIPVPVTPPVVGS